MTTISIAMATYNGAAFIREQLESLASQTYLPVDLVVTDDGSTDDTLAIIADFAETAPFAVNIHRNEKRLGYRANFMKCAALCSGDLIAFCDQDDIWFEDKLATQLRHFDDPAVILSSHNVRFIDQSRMNIGGEFRQFTQTDAFPFWSIAPFAHSPGFTQVFRRKLVELTQYWEDSLDYYTQDVKMAHDQWYFFIGSMLGYVKYDTTLLAYYRQHDSNASGRKTNKFNRTQRIPYTLFHSRLAHYEKLAIVIANRRDILRGILATWPQASSDEEKQRLRTAIHMYNSLLDSTKRRRELYASKTRKERAKILLSSVRQGDYRYKGRWKYKLTGLAHDFIFIFAR